MAAGRTTRLTLAVTACGLLAAPMFAQKIEIEAHRDEKADFKALRTYGWLPPPPAIQNTTPELSNPNLSQEVLGPHIVAAVDRELTARGLKRLDEGEPDVHVVYYAALTMTMNSDVLGSYYQYTTGWAIPLGPMPTTSLRTFERGTIIVDVISKSAKKAIWRGSMATNVNQETTREKRIERINQAIKRTFERFPLPAQKR